MAHSTNVSPPPYHDDYHRPCPKNWPRPLTLMTTRSPSRLRPHNRTYFVYLTKTCPLRPASPTSAHQHYYSCYLRPFFYFSWGMRRPKPNPITKNLGLLLHCPSRLNNSSHTVLPLPDPTNPYYIYYHNIFNISSI